MTCRLLVLLLCCAGCARVGADGRDAVDPRLARGLYRLLPTHARLVGETPAMIKSFLAVLLLTAALAVPVSALVAGLVVCTCTITVNHCPTLRIGGASRT